MVATRQDAWKEDDDLLLAEVTLRHIREGSTQLAAFEEVGYRMQRTPAACGFRWNSLVRKKYESAIQIAKAQRQQRKSRGKSRFITDSTYMNDSNYPAEHNRVTEYTSPQETHSFNGKSEYLKELSQDITPVVNNSGINFQNSHFEALDFDDVIRFLRSQKDSYKKFKQIDKELREREKEIERLRDENHKMRKELGSVQNEFQTVNDDYKALIKIMDRARKLAFLADEEQEEKVSFKMDRNGNLERVDKS